LKLNETPKTVLFYIYVIYESSFLGNNVFGKKH